MLMVQQVVPDAQVASVLYDDFTISAAEPK